MLDWLKSQQTDHPMHSIEEAERLLTGLSDDPPQAIEEIAAWLTTLASAAGFKLATRMEVIKLVDESGQPFEPLVTQQLLSRTISEFERTRLWRLTVEFWQRVAGAYWHCLDEMKRDPAALRAHRGDLPLLLVRTLRALAHQCRVLRLRYMPVGEPLWRALYDCYQLSEAEQCDNQRVTAYDGETLPTTPRTELIRALLLDIARPESMQPKQTELAARVTARYADAVLFKRVPEAGCNWYLDLAQPRAPELATGAATMHRSVRFFGAGVVLVKLQEVVKFMTSRPGVKEQRFGEDYTTAEKLAIVQRLLHYWGDQAPYRREPRKAGKAELVVTQGWTAARQTIPRAAYKGWGELIVGMDAELKAALGITTEPVPIVQEKWLQRDASRWGLGVEIPRTSEPRVHIGVLLTLAEGGRGHRVGVVRRLYRDGEQNAFAGIELLARSPVTAILRRVGHGGMQLAHSDAETGGSASDYLNAILLDGNAHEGRRHELLFARGEFIAGIVYEAMIGDAKRALRAEELLERGEDYDRVRYAWAQDGAAGNAS